MDFNIFVINLEHRIDRLEHVTNEFKKLNLKFERFNAIQNDYGILGCTKSHLACIKLAKERNYDYCMICEDDLQFNIDNNELFKYINAFIIDDKLNILCLISHVPKRDTIKKYNDLFNTSTDITTATCYVVKKIYYDKLINLFEYAQSKLEETKQTEIYANDIIWKQLQKVDVFVFPNKTIGIQYANYSDIEKTFAYSNNLSNDVYYVSILNSDNVNDILYQIASVYGIAKIYNKKFAICNINLNNNLNKIFKYIFEKNTICNYLPIDSFKIYNRYNDIYDNEIPNYEYNHLLLLGSFKNELYFMNYKNEILELFKISSEQLKYIEKKYNKLSNGFFIYIDKDNYSEIFYENKINQTQQKYNNCIFYIVSNDINNCKNNKIFNNLNKYFIENENNLICIYIMSLCKLGGIYMENNISWWGSYLNVNL